MCNGKGADMPVLLLEEIAAIASGLALQIVAPNKKPTSRLGAARAARVQCGTNRASPARRGSVATGAAGTRSPHIAVERVRAGAD